MLLNGQKNYPYDEHIDKNDVDWVMSLFAKNAIYYRADSVYDGCVAIDSFVEHQEKFAATITLMRPGPSMKKLYALASLMVRVMVAMTVKKDFLISGFSINQGSFQNERLTWH